LASKAKSVGQNIGFGTWRIELAQLPDRNYFGDIHAMGFIERRDGAII
jgi:hypothetical protein